MRQTHSNKRQNNAREKVLIWLAKTESNCSFFFQSFAILFSSSAHKTQFFAFPRVCYFGFGLSLSYSLLATLVLAFHNNVRCQSHLFANIQQRAKSFSLARLKGNNLSQIVAAFVCKLSQLTLQTNFLEQLFEFLALFAALSLCVCFCDALAANAAKVGILVSSLKSSFAFSKSHSI